MRYEKLFSPIKLGPLELKNRLIMPAAATQFGLKGGYVSDRHVKWYGELAAGGASLVITEAMGVVKRPSGNLMRMLDDSYKEGFKRIVDAIHENGAKCGVQLVHWPSVSEKYHLEPTDMRVEEFHEMNEQYCAAAKRVYDCGADFVQLHAAHGYTFASLLSPAANRRTDEYGGSIKKRAKALLDCIALIKEECGQDALVNCRINGDDFVAGGLTNYHACETAKLLEDAGVFYLDVSAGGRYEDGHLYTGYSGQRCIPPADYGECCNLYTMENIKKAVNIPVQGVGRIPMPHVAERILQEDRVDVVGVCRPLIVDPEWPKKAMEGRENEIKKCIYCCNCIDTARYFRPLSCPLWKEGRNGDPDFAFEPTPKDLKVEIRITYDKLPYKGKGWIYVPHVEGFPQGD
ncbi:NADH:flavin oxidoreductase [Thermodesulfobacteriota bacterium]